MNRGFGRLFNPPRFTQQPVYDDDVYDDHNDDEISEPAQRPTRATRPIHSTVNSSPCPPERRSYSQYPIPQQAQYYDDPIDEYMEGSYFEGEQFSEPPYSHDPAQQQAEYAPVEDTYETNYYGKPHRALAYPQLTHSRRIYPRAVLTVGISTPRTAPDDVPDATTRLPTVRPVPTRCCSGSSHCSTANTANTKGSPCRVERHPFTTCVRPS